MLITTPISLGEILDKISILVIKEKNISDPNKQKHIKKELLSLYDTLDKYISRDKVREHINSLISINAKLWKIEDKIRVANGLNNNSITNLIEDTSTIENN